MHFAYCSWYKALQNGVGYRRDDFARRQSSRRRSDRRRLPLLSVPGPVANHVRFSICRQLQTPVRFSAVTSNPVPSCARHLIPPATIQTLVDREPTPCNDPLALQWSPATLLIIQLCSLYIKQQELRGRLERFSFTTTCSDSTTCLIRLKVVATVFRFTTTCSDSIHGFLVWADLFVFLFSKIWETEVEANLRRILQIDLASSRAACNGEEGSLEDWRDS